VPADVQTALGKRIIAQSLGTDSPLVARAARDTLDAEWGLAIKRARSGNRIGPEDIEQEASRAYDTWLVMLAQLDDADLASVFMEGHKETIEQRRWIDADVAVAAIEKRTGFIVPRDGPEFASLAGALLRAQIAAATGYLKAREAGEPSDKPAYFTPQAIDLTTLQPVARRKPAKGDGFLKVCDRYLAERDREKGSVSHRRRSENAFRLFSDFSGDIPLAGVDRAMAANFLDTVAKLHPKWGQQPGTKDMPLAELLKRFPGRLSNASLNHYASALKTLFDWARKRGAIKGDNPFSEQSRKAGEEGYLPYTTAELKKLLSGVTGMQRWVILIALYSGMRQAEVCGLTAEEVKCEDKIWFFDLPERKSPASQRRVPIHSKLIELGLLKLVKKVGRGPLWPEIKRSVYFSKWFTRHRTALGLERDGLSMHSLRKNMTEALDAAGVAESDIKRLLGHAQVGVTMRRYSRGPGLQRLATAVEAVRYEGL
jgi:integrase